MRESCLAEFDAHWQCLERNNQASLGFVNIQLTAVLSGVPQARDDIEQMRLYETGPSCFMSTMNTADGQNLTKTIPGSPEGQPQVHEKKSPIFTRVQK